MTSRLAPALALSLAACGGPPCLEPPAQQVLARVLEGSLQACERSALESFVARRQATTGPWRQELHLATSEDGLAFRDEGSLGITRAAVPEVVVGPDGRYYLFHVDGDIEQLLRTDPDASAYFRAHGLPGVGALSLSVSEDGRHFEPVPDFSVEGIVLGMVVDPDVIRLPDGSWRLYYIGMPIQRYGDGSWAEGAAHEVFYAHSTDLVHWAQAGRAVEGPFADPTVWCGPAGHCEMLSFGLDRSTSEDGGQIFAFQGPLGVSGFAPELVPLEPQGLRVYYNDKLGGAPVRSRRSIDGATWEAEEGERLAGTYGEAPTLARLPDGRWAMYFHTFTSAADLPRGAGHLRP
jgi:hypothetical protein